MGTQGLSFAGILLRLLSALVLVFATFNPSGYSYYHWLRDTLPGYSVLLIFAGVVLLIGWTIFLRATTRSLGAFGLILAFLFFGTLLWLVIDMGWVSPDNINMITYLILILLSAVLAIGMSWSHIRRRLSGQADVDEIDE